MSKRLVFNTSNLRDLCWIGLSGCHKMLVNVAENSVPSSSFVEGHLKNCGIIFPGNRIPDWFSHGKDQTSNGKSCKIDVSFDGISTRIALCAVIGQNPTISRERPLPHDHVESDFHVVFCTLSSLHGIQSVAEREWLEKE